MSADRDASLTTDSWDDYVSALLRIETPGGVIWVRPPRPAHVG
jgi:hypothetical protein